MTIRSFDDANSLEARQFLLDRRCERTHPKRHRTKRRSAKQREAKKIKVAHKLAIKAALAERYHSRVRAFWSGVASEHP